MAQSSDEEKKRLMLAIGASILIGASTMFMPTALLESITGATGLSELVPATAAPLGDTARALIAFGTGALVLAFLLVLNGRKQAATARGPAADSQSSEEMEMISSARLADIKSRIPSIRMPQMPWQKREGEVRELIDLVEIPRLRSGDAHPDAPPRRPLSALNDIAPQKGDDKIASEDAASEQPVPIVQPAAPQVAETATEDAQGFSRITIQPEAVAANQVADVPVAQAPEAPAPTAEPAAPAPAAISAPVATPAAAAAPSQDIAARLDYLEQAIARREVQFSELSELMAAAADRADSMSKAVAASAASLNAHLASAMEAVTPPAPAAPVAQAEPSVPEEVPAPTQAPAQQAPVAAHPADSSVSPERPPLGIVPEAAAEPDEMDEALNAALATLQRMNSVSR